MVDTASIAFMSNFPQSGIGCGKRPEATQERNVANSMPIASAASFSLASRRVVIAALTHNTTQPVSLFASA
jgi:hypothetical protein